MFPLDAARAAALAAALCCAGASAQDEPLIPGPGSTLTENKCKICHELQHIRRAQLSPEESRRIFYLSVLVLPELLLFLGLTVWWRRSTK